MGCASGKYPPDREAPYWQKTLPGLFSRRIFVAWKESGMVKRRYGKLILSSPVANFYFPRYQPLTETPRPFLTSRMSMWNQRLPRDPGNPAQADSDPSRDREGKSPEFALLSGGESNRDEALGGLPADELDGEAPGLSFRCE